MIMVTIKMPKAISDSNDWLLDFWTKKVQEEGGLGDWEKMDTANELPVYGQDGPDGIYLTVDPSDESSTSPLAAWTDEELWDALLPEEKVKVAAKYPTDEEFDKLQAAEAALPAKRAAAKADYESTKAKMEADGYQAVWKHHIWHGHDAGDCSYYRKGNEYKVVIINLDDASVKTRDFSPVELLTKTKTAAQKVFDEDGWQGDLEAVANLAKRLA